jgi:predicted  nucleic acid-binding Zn ribbon protein
MEVDMFGRIQLYIFIGILVFGSLTAGYYSWRKGIEREALLEYNQKQMEQDAKDKETLRQQVADIEKKRKEIETENAASKKVFEDKINSISANLNSKETAAEDKPSSKVLKETVDKLKDVVK